MDKSALSRDVADIEVTQPNQIQTKIFWLERIWIEMA